MEAVREGPKTGGRVEAARVGAEPAAAIPDLSPRGVRLGELVGLARNGPRAVAQRRALAQAGPQPAGARRVAGAVQAFRSSQAVVQLKYEWSNTGDDGAIIGDHHVIKFSGLDPATAALDQLAGAFGFTPTNPRVVRPDDGEWATVLEAVEEAGGWTREGSEEARPQAVLMDRLPGDMLFESPLVKNASDTPQDRGRIVTLCRSLGRMLVMDLLTRNNDRFNLRGLQAELQITAEELEDEDAYAFGGNEENMLVDPASGAANPIDSGFTPAPDEARYAHDVAVLLTDRLEDLVTAGMVVLVGQVEETEGWDWSREAFARDAFREGVEAGIDQLLAL